VSNDYSKATLDWTIPRIIGRPSTIDIIHLLEDKLLTNYPVTTINSAIRAPALVKHQK